MSSLLFFVGGGEKILRAPENSLWGRRKKFWLFIYPYFSTDLAQCCGSASSRIRTFLQNAKMSYLQDPVKKNEPTLYILIDLHNTKV